MLTFGTFLEHATSQFEKQKSDEVISMLPPLAETHIFWLGDDQEFQKHVHEIRDELVPEMKERIHLPFQDTTTVSVIPTNDKWQRPIWTLDRMIENHPILDELRTRKDLELDSGQAILIIRYQVLEQTPLVEDPIMIWAIAYHGVQGDDVHFQLVPSAKMRVALDSNIGNPSSEKWKQMQYESKVILDYAAALSHPENYVVRVTPELTPREERRVAAGRPRPPQKAKHFIVVDHEVLVGMRGQAGGTHASPVPHERRGHWRRLAERCRHAKLLGRDRVFVKPALVGDPAWKGEKNFYEVLPDLGKVQA
jgi:hypothetical protein